VETNAVGEFFSGVRLLGRGMATYGRSPRLLVLGLIPAVISGVLFLGLFVLLFVFLGRLAELVTWFADDWSSGARQTARVLAGIGIVGLAGLIGILTFTAVTLAIGDPFYEKISERIEERLGGVPNEVTVPWWRSLLRSIGDFARMLVISVGIGIPLFFAEFIPLVGQTVVPVVGATVAGWFLAVSLVGVPFGRRGLRLPDRRRALRANRPLALGFGVSVFLCFLIPLGAILVMPAAVAGGTLLARRVLGLSTEE
jgi:CysZ protein